MSSEHVRTAQASDLAAIRDLYLEFHEFHVAGVPERLQIPGTYDTAGIEASIASNLSARDVELFVVEDRDTLVGLAEVRMETPEEDPAVVNRPYAKLQTLFVSPENRRLGLGSLLMKRAEDWARANGAHEMRLDIWEFPGGPLAFYEQRGYRSRRRELCWPLS